VDIKLISVLLGVVFGAAGYWITTFWMQPILRYREIRSKVLSDLVFYSQVTNAKGLSERMKKLYENRVEANRRSSADLTACLVDLPRWYRVWLRVRGCDIDAAVQNLIEFSNTTEYEAAAKRIERIKKSLCIKTTVV
jgi:hypothetical protein